MISILYDDRQNFLTITGKYTDMVKKAIETVIQAENGEGDFEVSVSFVTNDEIKELNRIYRNVNRETDVLSFPMDDEYNGVTILGDIVLSTEKIIEQANEFRHSLEREMVYLTVHSMLHLFGYDHISQAEREIMRNREKAIMKEMKLFK